MKYKETKTKEDKKLYKEANKIYKKDLRKNTTYRKGVVKEAVGKDAARKYLQKAKALEKYGLDSKEYRNNYNIERAKARKYTQKSQYLSRKLANLKRSKTIALNSAVTIAAIYVGVNATNKILNKNIDINSAKKFISIGKNILKYF